MLHDSKGTPVNAVYGVLNMLLKLLTTYLPSHILIAKDVKGGSFRNDLYDQYKAHRSDPPAELIPQFTLINILIEKMEIPSLESPGFEADDLIGSACTQWKNNFDKILIASSDKDLMQFVGDNIYMVDTMKNIIYDKEKVFDKMGVYPEQIKDYLSIVGDPSDNIPGMKGIGAKGASKLLHEYQTLEKCIKESSQFKSKRLIDAFTNHLEEARLSQKLVTIVTDIHLNYNPEDLGYTFYPNDELLRFLKDLEFQTILLRLEEIRRNYLLDHKNKKVQEIFPYSITHIQDESAYRTIVDEIQKIPSLAIHTEYNSVDTISKKFLLVAITLNEEKVYIFTDDYSDKVFRVLYEQQDLIIFSEQSKRDYIYAQLNNLNIKATLFDITQAHYILFPEHDHALETLTKEILDRSLLFYLNKKDGEFISSYPQAFIFKFIAERVISIYQIALILQVQLKNMNLESIFYKVDSPIIPILASMEREGICIDLPYFKEFQQKLNRKLTEVKDHIYQIIGREINLNSPKQIEDLLSNKLHFSLKKKIKTGYSTGSDVLESLVEQSSSPIPKLILQYREYSKILSTYVAAIPLLQNTTTSKIHTHFNQHGTSTGRLSSYSPNLQNIPIKSPMGKLVRKGFIPTSQAVFLTADYSQIELKLLATFSNDPIMLQTFHDRGDIHIQTAAEIFGITLQNVSTEQRSAAKAVNFGLMYGQSSFGLSRQLQISRQSAKEYIETYFTRFAQVKIYLDSLKELCEQTGYAETYHGRRRNIQEIHSNQRRIKSNAQRLAINTPIQGTAADIIKLAMIKINEDMKKFSLDSRLLLQIHDELIFNVPENEISTMKDLVQKRMENVVQFQIPLTVDLGIGKNWYQLK